MKTLIEYLDEAELLCHTARRRWMQAEKFSAEVRVCIDSVSRLLASKPWTAGFDRADFDMAKAVEDYDQNPNLAGIGKIGNALVAYRREAVPREASTPSSLAA
jgi:hypothetical protein